MNKKEFIKKMNEDHEWAPGWEVIDGVFDKLYPDQKPEHFGTVMTSRAMFGGNEYLDGYSIYTSPKGYKHIVTYGMTQLYADEEFFGGEWNKWGYEMTIKLAEENTEDCMWALNLLGNLARYTYTQERFFEPLQFIAGDGSSLHQDVDSNITALIAIEDTEAPSQDTIYGRTDFIQLVGITEKELDALREDRNRIHELYEKMKKDNPDFVTDMKRTKSYIE